MADITYTCSSAGEVKSMDLQLREVTLTFFVSEGRMMLLVRKPWERTVVCRNRLGREDMRRIIEFFQGSLGSGDTTTLHPKRLKEKKK